MPSEVMKIAKELMLVVVLNVLGLNFWPYFHPPSGLGLNEAVGPKIYIGARTWNLVL